MVIIIFLIALAIFIIPKIQKKEHASPSRRLSNKRTAFRLYLQDVPCQFHTLFSPEQHTGSIRDLSVSGMRLETDNDSLTEKSVLLVEFQLGNESFSLECIVKRKHQIDSWTVQYGVKFVNVPIHVEERLYKQIWDISRKRVRH